MAQPGPPTDLKIIKQTPEPKALAQPKSTITITLGRPPKSAARLLMERLVPSVYAAEPERQAQPSPQGNPGQQSNSSNTGNAKLQPSNTSPLDDDLISISCFDAQGCSVLGRSARLYKITSNREWTYTQVMFRDVVGFQAVENMTLLGTLDKKRTIVAKEATGALFFCNGKLVRYISGTATSTDQLADPFQTHFSNSTDSSVGFDIGRSGLIKKNKLTSSNLVPSGTTADLRSMEFLSPNTAWIVGDQGIILSTADDGNTWRHETQGPEGATPNHRLPALWYWIVAFLMMLTCSVVVAAPLPPQRTEFSVADWAVTDAPLKPGDLDSLDFTPMALGLSRFIRNPKTQPPVTIAIEGAWGEGKSSVMALLRVIWKSPASVRSGSMRGIIRVKSSSWPRCWSTSRARLYLRGGTLIIGSSGRACCAYVSAKNGR